MKFYRYEAVQYAEHDFDGELVAPIYPNPVIVLREYVSLQETPKGYWIGHRENYFGWKKWVSKTSKRRFAYPTQEEALQNYLKRTERSIKIMTNFIEYQKVALHKAKEIKL